RGELFSLPAKEGYVANLTATSSAAERYPAWSPDGKKLAYWSDASGEYQLMIRDMESEGPPRQITNFKNGFHYNIFWSGDNEHIVTVNQAMEILLINVKSGNVKKVDEGKYMYEGGLRSFEVDWSPDNRYFIYSLAKENRATSSIYLYDTKNSVLSKLTSGFYADDSPAFSADGKYIFYTTNRSFNPVYSNLDNTFVYPNATGIVVGTVSKDTPSLLTINNDAFKPAVDQEEEKPDKKQKDKKESDAKESTINFDADGFENRIEMLDIESGNIGNLASVDGKLLYMRYPNSGSGSGVKNSLELYDFEKKESTSVIGDIQDYMLTADSKKLLVSARGKLAVIDVAPGQSIKEMVPTDQMMMTINPREEWRQIFNEVWRLERDYFYDPNMHGVDWPQMKVRYGNLIEQANSRNDVNIIIGDLIGELDASHTYVGGGDRESANRMNVGYLGADFVVEKGVFRVQKIVQGAPWDVEDRSPLLKTGVNVSEGDYILAINDVTLDTNYPIYKALQGLA
ncbi:MAG: PDZ domain-containing protein, partial [Fulvivirga sp.]|nr:PDZ domain-containing protein [Fulvivirga sp.]